MKMKKISFFKSRMLALVYLPFLRFAIFWTAKAMTRETAPMITKGQRRPNAAASPPPMSGPTPMPRQVTLDVRP